LLTFDVGIPLGLNRTRAQFPVSLAAAAGLDFGSDPRARNPMPKPLPNRRSSLIATALLATALCAAPADAQPVEPRRPFVATLSNTTPLAFGMDAQQAARALATPLAYVEGRSGEEIYLAIRNIGGSGFFNRRDRLYLQFRRGRLTGWKGDWGRNWMWQ
jgi:hypothetical protein